MKPVSPIFVILCAFFWSCGDSKPVSGGVDGNPNFLQGRLLRPNADEPAPQVAVVLSGSDAPAARSRATSAWRPLDTTWTDSDGRFAFRVESDGAYLIEARVGDSLVLSRQVDFASSSGKRLDDAILPLPSGKVLLVDDFEPPASTHSFARWYSDAYGLGFLSNDPSRISISPSTIPSDPASGIEDCGLQGNCYHLATTSLVPDAIWDVTEVYDMFRPTAGECFDLSEADSVIALVRGTGTFRMVFWAKGIGLSQPDWSQTARELPLPGTWTRIAIPTDSIGFASGTDSFQWKNSCLHKITFGLRGDGELWIDDIRLHGVDILDLQTR